MEKVKVPILAEQFSHPHINYRINNKLVAQLSFLLLASIAQLAGKKYSARLPIPLYIKIIK